MKLAESHNRIFLDKLKSVRPYYNAQKWARDEEKRKNVLKVRMRKYKNPNLPSLPMLLLNAAEKEEEDERMISTESENSSSSSHLFLRSQLKVSLDKQIQAGKPFCQSLLLLPPLENAFKNLSV